MRVHASKRGIRLERNKENDPYTTILESIVVCKGTKKADIDARIEVDAMTMYLLDNLSYMSPKRGWPRIATA
jgi:hypothetical protein